MVLLKLPGKRIKTDFFFLKLFLQLAETIEFTGLQAVFNSITVVHFQVIIFCFVASYFYYIRPKV